MTPEATAHEKKALRPKDHRRIDRLTAPIAVERIKAERAGMKAHRKAEVAEVRRQLRIETRKVKRLQAAVFGPTGQLATTFSRNARKRAAAQREQLIARSISYPNEQLIEAQRREAKRRADIYAHVHGEQTRVREQEREHGRG